jgi:hypothetical protein
MSQQRIKNIQQRLQQMQQGYQHAFAGHPRASRDPQLLLAWITQLQELLTQVTLLPTHQAKSLKDNIQEKIKLYRKEHTFIIDLQDQNEAVLKYYAYIEWTPLIKYKYARHFAGQSRHTRDIELLKEMVLELKIHRAKLEKHNDEYHDLLSDEIHLDLQAHLEQIDQDISLYQNELKTIMQGRDSLDEEQKGNLWAQLANHQFQLYRQHFSQKQRPSRRLDLLERIQENLNQLQNKMSQLHDGFDPKMRDQNIQIVRKNIETYQKEVDQIQQVQNQMTYEEWVNALKKSFESIQTEYTEHFAGQSRTTRDLSLIVQLADELYDVAYQIKPFLQNSPHTDDQNILRTILDQVRNYHQEFMLIKQSQNETTKKSSLGSKSTKSQRTSKKKKSKKNKKILH